MNNYRVASERYSWKLSLRMMIKMIGTIYDLVDRSLKDFAMSTTATVSRNGMTLPMEQIVEFCRRWKIRQLEVFGSFLRDDFRPDSDLDFLYTFAADVHWTLLDLVTMDQELSAIVGRRGGPGEPLAVERSHNSIRRRHILGTAEPIYVEG